jgi:hypothetical protein
MFLCSPSRSSRVPTSHRAQRRRAWLGVEVLETRSLPATLPYGAIVADTISNPAASATYTFAATAGDKFALALTSTPTQDGFDAYAELFGPSGTRYEDFFALSERVHVAQETGTYTVSVHDHNLSETGSFTLGLEGIKPISPGATPLVPGGIVAGTIDAAIDVKQFTFNGQSGDVVTLALTSTPGQSGFDAYAQVFGPSGTRYDDFFATGQRPLTLAESGVFMVHVSDHNGAEQGSFTIGLEGINPISPNPTPLVKGGFVQGVIDTGIDVEQYTFQANVNDLIGISLTSTPGAAGFDSLADVYAPSGELVDSFFATGLRYITAAEAGTYMVQVHDHDYGQNGSFKVGLEGIKPPSPDALALPAGQAVPGAIDSINDVDQHLFYGQPGDLVHMTLTSTPGAPGFDALVDVFGPSGTLLDSFFAIDQRPLTLTETGVHLVQVHDHDFTQPGSYTFRVDWIAPAAGSIAGAVYDDANANSARGAGEPGLLGRVVFLDANGNGQPDAAERQTTTDVQGNYAFTSLAAGTYLVRAIVPAGWLATNPASGAQSVTIAAGQNRADVLFGQTPINEAPTVAAPIANLTVNEDAAPVLDHASLDAVFADVDDADAELSYTVTATTPGGILTATIDAGDKLDLAFLADAFGEVDVTVRATDPGGLFVEDTFHVSVGPVNDAPTVANAIADRTVLTSAAPVLDHADLNAVFVDVDDADGELTYTVSANTSAGLVTATIQADDTLDLSFTAAQTGVADITVRATDPDGLFIEDTFRVIVKAPVATTTTITQASPSPSTFGEPVTFTVTVVPGEGTDLPTGTLTFKDGGTTLGTSTPLANVGGVATATFTTTATQLGGGSHTITAVYGAVDAFLASTSADFTHTVNAAATTPTITQATPSPSIIGQTVTFTVKVTPGIGGVLPTGTLIFKAGDVTLGTSSELVDVAGVATATFTTAAGQLGVSNHTITALYAGDLNFTAGTSTVFAHTVNPLKARPDFYTAKRNRKLKVLAPTGLLANDQQAGAQVKLVKRPAQGKLTLKADGSFTYVPARGFLGKVTFKYRIANAFAVSTAALVTIKVKK